jgi:hypothetical protein
MKRSFIYVIALLLIFGLSSAVMAQAEKTWGMDFQKEFGELEYFNQSSWDSNLENKAEVIQEGENNRAAIRQNGSGNNALTVQNGNFNNALITQTGAGNSAVIKQFSDNNSALINQTGSNNQAVIIQK